MEKWTLVGALGLMGIALMSKSAGFYIGILFFVLLCWQGLKHFNDCHRT